MCNVCAPGLLRVPLFRPCPRDFCVLLCNIRRLFLSVPEETRELGQCHRALVGSSLEEAQEESVYLLPWKGSFFSLGMLAPGQAPGEASVY